MYGDCFCRLSKGVLSTTSQETTRFLYFPAVLPVMGIIDRCKRIVLSW